MKAQRAYRRKYRAVWHGDENHLTPTDCPLIDYDPIKRRFFAFKILHVSENEWKSGNIKSVSGSKIKKNLERCGGCETVYWPLRFIKRLARELEKRARLSENG